jgi:Gram-negative bacterial TonB protein C-terminal
VLESRQGGLAHYTDLEFVDRDPKFWDVPAEQPVAARQTPEIQKIKPGETSPVAALGKEPSSRPGGDIPLTFLETNTVAPVCPQSTNQPEWNDANEQELIAALIAIDAKQLAKRESDKKRATEFEREAASEGAAEQNETISDTANDAEVFSTPASRICRTRKFTGYRNPIAVGIAASVSIAAVLSIAWHIKRSSIHSNRPSASTTQSSQHAVSSTGQSSPTRGSAVAIGTPMTADTPQRSNVVQDPPVSATPKVKTNNVIPSSHEGALAQAKSGKLNELSTEEIIPAKILSQSLPSIPPWAKGLDMDGIVQLDALIDENGNVAEVKPMSGPRLLQRAAERAVALWIFQPALSDGKPTATHIVLTVQFQR